MLSIEKLKKFKFKLKKFIMQVKIQINNKGPKLPIFIKKNNVCKNVLDKKTTKMGLILSVKSTSK